MSKTTTKADRLTFTKLFAQRSGTSFAAVLNQCCATPELLTTFNAVNQTSLVFDASLGRMGVREPQANFEHEADLFADFAWREVFLQINYKLD